MKEIVQQFMDQIEQDQKFSPNTRTSYKSDLNDLLEYAVKNNTQLSDINQTWVKEYLKNLESTNKERNSFNRRASTFRLFLRFLYRQKLAPTNYSLIVNNQTTFEHTETDELETSDIKKLLEETKLKIDQRLILLFIGKLGLTGTQVASLNTFQVDFENRAINLSDTEKIELPFEIFIILRDYLLESRPNILNANEELNLFINENGKPLTELDIYKLVKQLSETLSLQGKLTTRSLKKLKDGQTDILSIQKEILSIVSP